MKLFGNNLDQKQIQGLIYKSVWVIKFKTVTTFIYGNIVNCS